MKKRNVLLAALLVLSLCLTLALPASAAVTPRIYQSFDISGIKGDGNYNDVSGGVVLGAGTTVTITGTWYPPNASLWVALTDRYGNSHAEMLRRSNSTVSFTVSDEGYYTLQVSSMTYDITQGTLLVEW